MLPDAKKVKELTDEGYSDSGQMALASSLSCGDNFPWDRRERETESKGSFLLKELVTHLLCAPGAHSGVRSLLPSILWPVFCKHQ